ncbi:glutamine amidotransferase [Erwinia sp. CPCC 100877]|nr:glutamine amidotransferase [Erwinia sp. CPCC 100877]
MTEVLFVLLEDYADWETAFLAAALQPLAGFTVKTVSNQRQAVHSIGGFTTVPDYTLEEAIDKEFAALILIGGYSWRKEAAAEVTQLVKKAEQNGAVMGAICDASVYLGSLGVLDTVKHTSNQLQELQSYAGTKYKGAKNYQEQQAVRDKNIITANGTAPLEFAKEVLLALKAMPEKEISQWYDFYKLGYYEILKVGNKIGLGEGK